MQNEVILPSSEGGVGVYQSEHLFGVDVIWCRGTGASTYPIRIITSSRVMTRSERAMAAKVAHWLDSERFDTAACLFERLSMSLYET